MVQRNKIIRLWDLGVLSLNTRDQPFKLAAILYHSICFSQEQKTKQLEVIKLFNIYYSKSS